MQSPINKFLAVFTGLTFFAHFGLVKGAVILNATEDNFVLRSADSTIIQGPNATTLATKKYDNGNARNIYLKFDLTGQTSLINQAASFTITSATGIQAAYPTNWAFALYGLNTDSSSNYTWTEANLTNINAPGYVAGGLPSGSTLLGNFSITTTATASSSGTVFTINFSNLANYLQTNNTITLILISTDQGDLNPSFSFASAEHGTLTGPQLILGVPEPGRAILSCMGLLLLFQRRRTKTSVI